MTQQFDPRHMLPTENNECSVVNHQNAALPEAIMCKTKTQQKRKNEMEDNDEKQSKIINVTSLKDGKCKKTTNSQSHGDIGDHNNVHIDDTPKYKPDCLDLLNSTIEHDEQIDYNELIETFENWKHEKWNMKNQKEISHEINDEGERIVSISNIFKELYLYVNAIFIESQQQIKRIHGENIGLKQRINDQNDRIISIDTGFNRLHEENRDFAVENAAMKQQINDTNQKVKSQSKRLNSLIVIICFILSMGCFIVYHYGHNVSRLEQRIQLIETQEMHLNDNINLLIYDIKSMKNANKNNMKSQKETFDGLQSQINAQNKNITTLQIKHENNDKSVVVIGEEMEEMKALNHLYFVVILFSFFTMIMINVIKTFGITDIANSIPLSVCDSKVRTVSNSGSQNSQNAQNSQSSNNNQQNNSDQGTDKPSENSDDNAEYNGNGSGDDGGDGDKNRENDEHKHDDTTKKKKQKKTKKKEKNNNNQDSEEKNNDEILQQAITSNFASTPPSKPQFIANKPVQQSHGNQNNDESGDGNDNDKDSKNNEKTYKTTYDMSQQSMICNSRQNPSKNNLNPNAPSYLPRVKLSSIDENATMNILHGMAIIAQKCIDDKNDKNQVKDAKIDELQKQIEKLEHDINTKDNVIDAQSLSIKKLQMNQDDNNRMYNIKNNPILQQMQSELESSMPTKNPLNIFDIVSTEFDDGKQKQTEKKGEESPKASDPTPKKKQKKSQNKHSKKKKKKKKKLSATNKPQYEPKKELRSQGNIQISGKMIKTIIPNRIKEQYTNLNHVIDRFTAINGGLIESEFDTKNGKIKIFNYDFHDKNTNKILYCIAMKQDKSKNNDYEWRMIDELMTASEIMNKYEIAASNIPQSPRSKSQFASTLQSVHENKIKGILTNSIKRHEIIKKTIWQKGNKKGVPVFSKKNGTRSMTLSYEKKEFIKQCKQSADNGVNDIKLIPILMFKGEDYWIEYVWIISIENNSIGLSFKCEGKNNDVKITGIHCDGECLLEQHELVSPPIHEHERDSLKNFESNITHLNVYGNLDNKYYKPQYDTMRQFVNKYVRINRNNFDADSFIKEGTEILSRMF